MTRTNAILVGVCLALVAGVWFEGYQAGHAKAESRSLQTSITALTRANDSLKAVFKVDTVKLTKQLTKWDTVKGRIDTLLKHDTLNVPVEVVKYIEQQADTTIKVCRVTLSDCALGWQKSQAEVDSLKKLQDLQPGFVARHLSLSLGGAIVEAGGKLYAGPSLSLGWKIWP